MGPLRCFQGRKFTYLPATKPTPCPRVDFSRTRNLIFDLGGVIIDIEPARTAAVLADLTGWTPAAWGEVFDRSGLPARFERGLVSPEGFLHELRALAAPLRAQPDGVLIAAWNALLLQIPPARVAALRRVQGRYRTFLLSNTNALHRPAVEQLLGQQTDASSLDELFEKTYYSYEMGLAKPHADSYEYVLADAGLDPAETVFFDDLADNIRAAAALGIPTVHVKPPQSLVDYLSHA